MVGVYLCLKKIEDRLDPLMEQLVDRIERILYSKISIQQLENLEELYNNKIDVIP